MTWPVRLSMYEKRAKGWRRYTLDLMEIGSFAPTHGMVRPLMREPRVPIASYSP